MERGLAIHPPRRERPLGGAPHLRVEIGLVPLVERAARAGAKRDAQDRGEAEHRRQLHRRDKQAAQAGEDDEAHHARLGQRDEIAPVGRQRGWIRHLEGGHCGAYKELGPERKSPCGEVHRALCYAVRS